MEIEGATSVPEFSQDHDRSTPMQVSDAVSALVRQYTGRGPVSARTTIDRDAVYVFMRGTLTKGEVVLVDRGHEEEVLSLRRAFQAAMRQDLQEIIEQAVGRPVVAFMSTNHTDPDCAIEVFVLGEETAAPSRPVPTEAAG